MKHLSFILNNPALLLYAEKEYNKNLNSYIQEHYNDFNKLLLNSPKSYPNNNFLNLKRTVQVEKEPLQIAYYPFLWNKALFYGNSFINSLKYSIPVLYSINENECWAFFRKAISSVPAQLFYDYCYEKADIPINNKAVFFKRKYKNNSDTGVFEFNAIPSFSNDNLQDIIENVISKFWYSYEVCYSRDISCYHEEKDYDFPIEISYDVLCQIELLKKNGGYSALAEAVIYMLETLKNEKPELLSRIKPIIIENKMLDTLSAPSPIVVDKHYRILLPRFGNLEVKMSPLPKALYLLFLRYPDGIRFKELYQYKSELLGIYQKVTNKYDNKEIEETIDNMVDMSQPLLSQKCSRTREAFRLLVDEHIARYYYIDGGNGEPKKISLPQSLIELNY